MQLLNIFLYYFLTAKDYGEQWILLFNYHSKNDSDRQTKRQMDRQKADRQTDNYNYWCSFPLLM